jgi:hypothetical protein
VPASGRTAIRTRWMVMDAHQRLAWREFLISGQSGWLMVPRLTGDPMPGTPTPLHGLYLARKAT